MSNELIEVLNEISAKKIELSALLKKHDELIKEQTIKKVAEYLLKLRESIGEIYHYNPLSGNKELYLKMQKVVVDKDEKYSTYTLMTVCDYEEYFNITVQKTAKDHNIAYIRERSPDYDIVHEIINHGTKITLEELIENETKRLAIAFNFFKDKEEIK